MLRLILRIVTLGTFHGNIANRSKGMNFRRASRISIPFCSASRTDIMSILVSIMVCGIFPPIGVTCSLSNFSFMLARRFTSNSCCRKGCHHNQSNQQSQPLFHCLSSLTKSIQEICKNILLHEATPSPTPPISFYLYKDGMMYFIRSIYYIK